MDRMHGDHVVLKPYVAAIEEAVRRRKMTRRADRCGDEDS
jgi:hypothetical protein